MKRMKRMADRNVDPIKMNYFETMDWILSMFKGAITVAAYGCFLAAAAIVVFGAKFIKTALDWILSMFKGAITVAAYGLITVRRGQGHNHPRMKNWCV